MSEDNPEGQIDEAKRDTDEDLGAMEDEADQMEERLEEHESRSEDVEVPEPGQGDDLSISRSEDNEAAGVGEEGTSEGKGEDEGETTEEAGQ